jgi:DNA-binding PucR family transcriptional regulator
VRGPGAALLFAGEEALVEAGDGIGVSGERGRLEDARDALAEAEAALRLAPVLGLRVVWWDRLGAYQLLAPLAGAPMPAQLRRLLDHPDAEPLVATLEAYLDRAGDARAAAQALFVHRTTLYHRLRRIERIAGVDLRDGDDRLLLHMALRIRRLDR